MIQQRFDTELAPEVVTPRAPAVRRSAWECLRPHARPLTRPTGRWAATARRRYQPGHQSDARVPLDAARILPSSRKRPPAWLTKNPGLVGRSPGARSRDDVAFDRWLRDRSAAAAAMAGIGSAVRPACRGSLDVHWPRRPPRCRPPSRNQPMHTARNRPCSLKSRRFVPPSLAAAANKARR